MSRSAPRAVSAARTVVPLVAGATAAAAGVLVLGWPHRPPLPGQPGMLAAAALVAVAVLVVFVPALPTWQRAELIRDRTATAVRPVPPVPPLPERVPAQRTRPPLAEAPMPGSLFEPAR